MATLNDILRPEEIDHLKPLAERIGAVRAELDQGVIVIKTVYGPSVELGRGATMKQAAADVMENARRHVAQRSRQT